MDDVDFRGIKLHELYEFYPELRGLSTRKLLKIPYLLSILSSLREDIMSRDTLGVNEFHPSCDSAGIYVSKWIDNPLLLEALASCAIENNRMAEICLSTIRRLKNREPVSDRYLLGLAWFLKELEERGTI